MSVVFSTNIFYYIAPSVGVTLSSRALLSRQEQAKGSQVAALCFEQLTHAPGVAGGRGSELWLKALQLPHVDAAPYRGPSAAGRKAPSCQLHRAPCRAGGAAAVVVGGHVPWDTGVHLRLVLVAAEEPGHGRCAVCPPAARGTGGCAGPAAGCSQPSCRPASPSSAGKC